MLDVNVGGMDLRLRTEARLFSPREVQRDKGGSERSPNVPLHPFGTTLGAGDLHVLKKQTRPPRETGFLCYRPVAQLRRIGATMPAG